MMFPLRKILNSLIIIHIIFLAQLQKMVRNCEPCVYARGALAIVFSNLDTFPIVCSCVPYKQLFTMRAEHINTQRGNV